MCVADFWYLSKHENIMSSLSLSLKKYNGWIPQDSVGAVQMGGVLKRARVVTAGKVLYIPTDKLRFYLNYCQGTYTMLDNNVY